MEVGLRVVGRRWALSDEGHREANYFCHHLLANLLSLPPGLIALASGALSPGEEWQCLGGALVAEPAKLKQAMKLNLLSALTRPTPLLLHPRRTAGGHPSLGEPHPRTETIAIASPTAPLTAKMSP